jgi:K+-sensing histidine kinase KdpD
MAHAYVDPGTGSMLWQMAAAAVIGSLFYVKRILIWSKNHFGANSPLSAGFLFATAFAAVATPVVIYVFRGQPPPRFNDLFLIGIVLTAYLFRWEPAVYLLGISLAVSVWVLPPAGSFHVASSAEWYRIVSFTIVSVFLVYLVTRIQNRNNSSESEPSYAMRAAAGAD